MQALPIRSEANAVPKFHHSYTLSNLDQLSRLAKRLASQLRVGDTLLLDGDLGAGKTTFIKALCQALGSPDEVTSPTYTIAQLYTSPLGPLVHIDAYRLNNPGEVWDLGYDEQMESGLTFIEWGHRVGEVFPDALQLRLDITGENERSLEFVANSREWHSRLAAMAEMAAP